MLDDSRSIDMALSPAPGVTMLVIQDFFPWEDVDSDERLNQFKAKLKGYADYVASKKFLKEHPGADRQKVVISVIAATLASSRMKSIKQILTPGNPQYEIVVRFPENGKESPGSSKPWWKFW